MRSTGRLLVGMPGEVEGSKRREDGGRLPVDVGCTVWTILRMAGVLLSKYPRLGLQEFFMLQPFEGRPRNF